MDGAFQALFLLLTRHLPRHHRAPYLPSWFGRMLFFTPGQPRHARATLLRVSTRSVVATFELYDDTGNVLARFEDCRFRRADWRSASGHETCAYRTQFEPSPHPAAPAIPILPEPAALAEALEPVLNNPVTTLPPRRVLHDGSPLVPGPAIALAHELAKPWPRSARSRSTTASDWACSRSSTSPTWSSSWNSWKTGPGRAAGREHLARDRVGDLPPS